jgi:hypothetical protein
MRIGVVQVLPVHQSVLACSELLHLFDSGPECRSCANFGLFSLDSNVEKEHNGVVLDKVETQDVASTFRAVLRKDGRNGLEHALGDKVVVGVICLPCINKLGVDIDNVFKHGGIVLESHGVPDVTKSCQLDV